MKPEWRWFMSVDFRGRWLITEGAASVETLDERIFGSLFFGDGGSIEADLYATFAGKTDDAGSIAIIVTSRDEEVPAFEVFGSAFVLESDGTLKKSIVLTDGTTVIGFARLEQMR